MYLSHHIRDPHTRQSIFTWISFLRTKLRQLKKNINLFSPNVRPCWMLGTTHFFSFKTSSQSMFVVLYMAQGKNRQNPNISKNPNIRWSKKYRTSLSLLKTRKCSDAVLQMKIKTNDQIQVKYINYKKSAYYGKVI